MGAKLLQQDIPVEEPSVKEVEKRGAKLFTGLKRLFSSLKKPKKTSTKSLSIRPRPMLKLKKS